MSEHPRSLVEDGSGVPTAPSAVLEGVGISVAFGGVRAVSDVDLSLRAGTVHGLIGPNGAGKTTLFDALSGVTRVTRGRVLLEGRDVTRASVAVRSRQGIRRTFQRQQTFGWLSVHDNLLVAMEWTDGGGGAVRDLVRWPSRVRLEAQRRQRVDEVLDLCGIGSRRHTPIGSLSIGDLRLVEIGRAIVDEPAVLLLDEPTSGLQHAEVERVGELVRQLVTQTNSRGGPCRARCQVRHGSLRSHHGHEPRLGHRRRHTGGDRSNPVVAEAYLGV